MNMAKEGIRPDGSHPIGRFSRVWRYRRRAKPNRALLLPLKKASREMALCNKLFQKPNTHELCNLDYGFLLIKLHKFSKWAAIKVERDKANYSIGACQTLLETFFRLQKAP